MILLMPDSKAQLRYSLKATLDAMSTNDRSAASSQLTDQILGSKAYRDATTILAYAALPTELSLDPFINTALDEGKAICIPAIDWAAKSMQPAQIQNLDTDLQTGRYDVRTPNERCPLVEPKNLDLILVPGLAFDSKGHRLGRGAGFYDRFIDSLNIANRPPIVGVCFGCQIIEKVPTEPHDHPMDLVITENGFQETQ